MTTSDLAFSENASQYVRSDVIVEGKILWGFVGEIQEIELLSGTSYDLSPNLT